MAGVSQETRRRFLDENNTGMEAARKVTKMENAREVTKRKKLITRWSGNIQDLQTMRVRKSQRTETNGDNW